MQGKDEWLALIAEAEDYINSGDLSSTVLEKMMMEDIKTGDVTALWYHVLEARNMLREDEVADVE